jgi:hypothetical protein
VATVVGCMGFCALICQCQYFFKKRASLFQNYFGEKFYCTIPSRSLYLRRIKNHHISYF